MEPSRLGVLNPVHWSPLVMLIREMFGPWP
jgi:hypothetical protein